jgi:hypothetical protein
LMMMIIIHCADCTTCTDGYYSTVVGQTSCPICTAGKFSELVTRKLSF